MSLQLEKRPVRQSGLREVPRLGVDHSGHFESSPSSQGQYRVFAVRPGLNLTVFDFVVGSTGTGLGSSISTPCVAIDVLFEAQGQGWMMPMDGGEEAPVPYRRGNLYLFYASEGAIGRYDIPVGSRFRGLDLRIDRDLLERLGATSLFEALDPEHFMHLGSVRKCWIGSLPLPASIAPIARRLFDLGIANADDLGVEARCLDMMNAAIDLLRRAPPPAVSARDRRRLEQARDMLVQDVARAWTLNEVARRVGLNEKRLKSGFRREFGMPVYAFLQSARLERAKQMLADPDANVTAVCHAVGYSSASHFAQLFSRAYGATPSRYRDETSRG